MAIREAYDESKASGWPFSPRTPLADRVALRPVVDAQLVLFAPEDAPDYACEIGRLTASVSAGVVRVTFVRLNSTSGQTTQLLVCPAVSTEEPGQSGRHRTVKIVIEPTTVSQSVYGAPLSAATGPYPGYLLLTFDVQALAAAPIMFVGSAPLSVRAIRWARMPLRSIRTTMVNATTEISRDVRSVKAISARTGREIFIHGELDQVAPFSGTVVYTIPPPGAGPWPRALYVVDSDVFEVFPDEVVPPEGTPVWILGSEGLSGPYDPDRYPAAGVMSLTPPSWGGGILVEDVPEFLTVCGYNTEIDQQLRLDQYPGAGLGTFPCAEGNETLGAAISRTIPVMRVNGVDPRQLGNLPETSEFLIQLNGDDCIRARPAGPEFPGVVNLSEDCPVCMTCDQLLHEYTRLREVYEVYAQINDSLQDALEYTGGA